MLRIRKDVMEHWATQIAQYACDKFEGKQVIATGWSPSGFYHLGNFREFLVCRATQLELERLGVKTSFILNIDDLDPLLRIPSKLRDQKKKLEGNIGMPLNGVPDPFGDYESYAEYFVNDLIEALERYEIDVQLLRTSKLYKEGKYDSYLDLFLDKNVQLNKILEETTGSPLKELVVVECKKCRRMESTVVTSERSLEGKRMYQCIAEKGGCGHIDVFDLQRETWKLKWRLDWPSRQAFLGVTIEPAGKDHGVAGGSIDTNRRIHKELFKRTPPVFPTYGFVTVSGKKMSGSTGVGMSLNDASKTIAQKYIAYRCYKVPILREYSLNLQSIDFITIIKEWDAISQEYEDWYKEQRQLKITQSKLFKAYKLSTNNEIDVGAGKAVEINDLLMTLQSSNFDKERTIQRLKERRVLTKKDESKDHLEKMLQRLEIWLKNYAPDDFKFQIQENIDFDKIKQIERYDELTKVLQEVMLLSSDSEALQQNLFELTKREGMQPKNMFKFVYLLLLGRERGPKAGNLLAALGRDRVKQQIERLEV